MKALKTVFAGLLIAAAAGCASYVAPETNLERVVTADTQFTAAVNAASDLREQGVIDDARYEAMTPAITRGDQALYAAYQALATDTPSNAIGYVRIVNQSLITINERIGNE